jgi:ligand-binding sensor domain-containing protein
MFRIPAAGWLLLLLCLSVPALGQDAVPARPLELSDLGAPAFTNFSARDGLPYTVVVGVATDREGFVWAATPRGVFRYNGRRWTGSDDPAMAHSVDDLFLDHEGTLWAGFRNNGLARYAGRRWHVEDLGTGLPSEQIRRFTETVDAHGARTLWAATWNKGLLRRQDGRWISDEGNASLPRGAILSMAQTLRLGGHLRQWAGTGTAGLWYRDEGERDWRRWHADGIDSAQIEFLLPVERGDREELWVSVFGLGLLRLSDAGERRWTRANGSLPTAELYDLAATALPGGERTIWVSSRSGLLRVHDGGSNDGSVQVFDRRHGLLSDVIRSLDAWRSPGGKDVLWLATEAGVSRTIPGNSAWSTASLMGARSIGVFGVLVEPDGHGGERLWVGSSDEGLALYQDGRWHRHSRGHGSLPADSIEMIVATTAADGTRTHWIGSGGELLRVHMGEGGEPVFEPIATPWRKATGEGVRDTLVRTFDGRAEQWVATRQTGIWRLRDGHWTGFRPAAARGQWGAGRLLEQRDADGRSWLWASTNQGLARFDGEHWDLFGREAGMPDELLVGLNLLPDPQGRAVLWTGSSSAGIVRIDVSDPRHPRVLATTCHPRPTPPPTAHWQTRRAVSTSAPTAASSSSRPQRTAPGARACSPAATAWCTTSATPTRSSSTHTTASGPARSAASPSTTRGARHATPSPSRCGSLRCGWTASRRKARSCTCRQARRPSRWSSRCCPGPANPSRVSAPDWWDSRMRPARGPRRRRAATARCRRAITRCGSKRATTPAT